MNRSALLVLLFLSPIDVYAVTTRAGVISGLMQQPSSQYYHGIYGGKLDVGFRDEGVIVRSAYLERPAFSNAGYQDQERGAFAFVGSKLTKTSWHGLYGFAGYGVMWGYVRSLDADDARESRFTIPGPAFGLEYAVKLKNVIIELSHFNLIGYRDRNQTTALVAWPYNYACLNIAYQLSGGGK